MMSIPNERMNAYFVYISVNEIKIGKKCANIYEMGGLFYAYIRTE